MGNLCKSRIENIDTREQEEMFSEKKEGSTIEYKGVKYKLVEVTHFLKTGDQVIPINMDKTYLKVIQNGIEPLKAGMVWTVKSPLDIKTGKIQIHKKYTIGNRCYRNADPYDGNHYVKTQNLLQLQEVPHNTYVNERTTTPTLWFDETESMNHSAYYMGPKYYPVPLPTTEGPIPDVMVILLVIITVLSLFQRVLSALSCQSSVPDRNHNSAKECEANTKLN